MPTLNQNAPAASWLKVADGLSNVLITTRSSQAVRVHVGTADPASDAAFHMCSYDRPFSMSGVDSQKVYIRANGSSDVPVTVTAA